VILKPWMRTDKWTNTFKEKVYLFQTFPEFKKGYEEIKIVENNLLVQEYIPGGDDHVFYCLVYFDTNSNCLAAFTGQKIRQWPVLTGSTATTIIFNNDTIRNETIAILKSVNYKGFGSIEYKKHAITGEYYITEPTVGRLNQQEFIATLNGINIPLIAYNSLTSAGLKPLEPTISPIIYIDEKNELRSVIKLYKAGKLTFTQWLNTVKGHRVYRYFNGSDPMVGFRLLLLLILYIIKPKKHR
jgi:D-aspartate ligase